MAELKYTPGGGTLKNFLRRGAEGPYKGTWPPVRGLRGPVGSGKSAASCIACFLGCLDQHVQADGKRRFRGAVIRNTYAELRTTTLNTWKDWFPEEVWGPILMNPPPYIHRMKKGDLEGEVLFIALDRPEDVKKLLSLELTWAWINEAREVPKSIVDATTSRVGRYPSMKDGGPNWYGVIMDTNAPDEDHWWPIMAGEAPVPDHFSREEALQLVKPEGWHFFTQPGGMVAQRNAEGDVTGYKLNPLAENLKNLVPSYYPTIIKGKSADWIKVYVLNQLGSISDGRPVYPDWDETMHKAKEPLLPVPLLPIHVGIDFGLTPAAVFGQNVRGNWRILSELVAQDMGIVRFAQLLRAEILSRYPEWRERLKLWGDPAGDYRAQTDENTPFRILRAAGLSALPAPGENDVTLRLEAVSGPLRRYIDKSPGLLVDPSCTTLLRGFAGGYHYRRLAVSGAERFEDTPYKNKFSHVHDALQYMALGGGEGRIILNTGNSTKPVIARVPHDPFNRRTAQTTRPSRGRFT